MISTETTVLTDGMMDSYKTLLLRADVVLGWIEQVNKVGPVNVKDLLFRRAQLIIMAAEDFRNHTNRLDSVKELKDLSGRVVQYTEHMKETLSAALKQFLKAVFIDDCNERFLIVHPELREEYAEAYRADQKDSAATDTFPTPPNPPYESPYSELGSDVELCQVFALDLDRISTAPDSPE